LAGIRRFPRVLPHFPVTALLQYGRDAWRTQPAEPTARETSGGAVVSADPRVAHTTTVWLRRLRAVEVPALRLVCFPHAGGTAVFYRRWRDELPPGIELYAVQYPGRLDRIAEPCIDDMDTMADAVTAAVTPLLDRPLALFGHSLGSVVAYEVARRLGERRLGLPVRLFVSGRAAPDRARPGNKHLASDDILWDELRRLNGTRPEVFNDRALRDAFLPALRSDYRLVEGYKPRPGPPLSCPLSVLLGDRDVECTVAQAQSWGALTRADFTVRVFTGDHFYLSGQEPAVVGEVIRQLGGAVPRPDHGWTGP
jgi:surfactin synthase thioesterase subunit